MTINGRTQVAGVAGSPIHHSLSPVLMNAWLTADSRNAVYVPLEIYPDRAMSAFRALPALGLLGVNVTAPLKTLALDAADDASAAARSIGAANLLLMREGKLYADNTDALGLLTACREHQLALNRGPVLVLGAGGAARAVVYALARSGIADIRISNRDPERAKSVAADLAPSAAIITWNDHKVAARDAGVIINTARAHDGDEQLIDWAGLMTHPHAIDINYGASRGRFLDGARAKGLQTLDGLAMLIGQARPSYQALFGHAPPTSVDAEDLLRKVLIS
tara:strand:- start:509 stop:1342 length:834 start_codon:yes stop_codon:yes gene_type:complete